MKNILLFVVDSLNYSHVQDSPIKLMPFCEQLKKDAVYCEKMYAQAPYTEAATMNIYCGQDVLDNGGYIYRYRNADSVIFEAMKKQGYTTYFNSFQPQCYPSSLRRGVDYIFNSVGYDQEALWPYRFRHYAQVHANGGMKPEDYETLYAILTDNFTEWLRFAQDMMAGDDGLALIRENAPAYDAKDVCERVAAEKEAFEQDKKTYVENVLREGTSHAIFRIPAYVQNDKIRDRSGQEQVRNEMKSLLRRIQRMDVRLNLKNGRGILKGPVAKTKALLKKPGMAAVKDLAKSMLLSANNLWDLDLKQRMKDWDRFKNAPSARSHIDHYIRWAAERPEQEKHFACIHIDDIHNPEMFFTYDSGDPQLLKQEIRNAHDLLDEIPSIYKGSLTHDLSLRYMDKVIEYLFGQLQEKGLKENTIVLICADHGFSFSGNPLRDSFVTNLYLENYQIPFLLVGSDWEPQRIDAWRSSKDIAATLCDLAGGEKPVNFTGHSVHETFEYDTLQIEYCGGGCPDMERRKLKIAAFDKKYFVGTEEVLHKQLTLDDVTEIYDLEKDPGQFCNLKGKAYDQECVLPLLDYINMRRKCIGQGLTKA